MPKEIEELEEQETFTLAEKDAEVSKAVENALKRREAKFKQELEEAVEEALKREKMTEEERLSEELKQRKAEVERREREAELREFKANVVTKLQEENLPIVFADLVVKSTNEEDSDDLIKQLRTTFDESIKEQVKAQARTPDPKDSEDRQGEESATDIQGRISEMAKKKRIGV